MSGNNDISKPPLVALTGGIGSGKSTALAAFARLGASVLDCDSVVHDLLRRADVREQVSTRLGIGVIDTGEAGRSMLAAAVFDDADKLDQLEAILHPLVAKEIEGWFASDPVASSPLAVVEIQLLFEAGLEDMFDARILVTATAASRRERMSERMAPEEFDKRLARQLPEEVKSRSCEYRYENAAGPDDLESFVRDTFEILSTKPEQAE